MPFNRAGIPFRVISGLLGQTETPVISLADEDTAARPEAIRAWKEIFEYVQAAKVRRTLRRSRFGFLGNNYSGMLDLYSDWTMIQAQTGLHVQILEMCDLDEQLQLVSPAEVEQKRREIQAFSRSAATQLPTRSPASRPKSSLNGRAASRQPRSAWSRFTISMRWPIIITAHLAMPMNTCRAASSSSFAADCSRHPLRRRRRHQNQPGDEESATPSGAGGSFSEIVVADYIMARFAGP